VHRFKVRYTVAGIGIVEEIISADSDFVVRRIVTAKYPHQQLMIVQVTQLD